MQFIRLVLEENRDSGVRGAGAALASVAHSLLLTADAIFGRRVGLYAAVICAAVLHSLAMLVVPLVQLLTSGGHAFPSRLRFAACLALYVALQTTIIAVSIATCVCLQLPPASGMMVMCEGTRLSMKVHSYVREKVVHGLTTLAELQAKPAVLPQQLAVALVQPLAPLGAPEAQMLQKRSDRATRRAAMYARLAELEVVAAAAPPLPSPLLSPLPSPRPPPPLPPPSLLPVLEGPSKLPPLAAALLRFRDATPPHAPLAAVKGAQPAVTIGGPLVELRRFAFFVFAPTLLFRDEYPRLEASHANLLRAATHAANFVASIVFGLLVVRAMVVPVLAHGSLGVLGGGTRPRTIAGFFLVVFEMIAPASLLFLLLFWAVLHSWLNAWAYLLRFADRRWYGPWWQSRTWGEFYREWNVVVGEWIGAYLFLDLQRGGASRAAALAAVFLISGVAHEVILTAAFGFFAPALFVFFTGPGTALLWITRFFNPRAANVFLWAALSLGVAILFVLYLDEGALRRSVGPGTAVALGGIADAIVPISWRAWAGTC